MRAVHHHGFSKIWFRTNGSHWAIDFPSGNQIWCKNVDRCPNYGPKSKFKMAAVRHLGFSKIWFLSIWVPNLVQKCRSTPKLWPEIWFMSKGSVATWATDFPYGCQIQCKNVDQRPNYGPKSKFKIAAVRHLGILISSHSLFVGLHQPVEFCANPNYSFEDMGIWIFGELVWNAYLRP